MFWAAAKEPERLHAALAFELDYAAFFDQEVIAEQLGGLLRKLDGGRACRWTPCDWRY